MYQAQLVAVLTAKENKKISRTYNVMELKYKIQDTTLWITDSGGSIIDYDLNEWDVEIKTLNKGFSYRMEVFGCAKSHLVLNVNSKKELLSKWKYYFSEYEGYEYEIIDVKNNDIILEGTMDYADLEVLEKL